MLWPQLCWKHSRPLAFFCCLDSLGIIVQRQLKVKSWNEPLTFTCFYPKKNVVFQNTAKQGRWIQVHSLPWDTQCLLVNSSQTQKSAWLKTDMSEQYSNNYVDTQRCKNPQNEKIIPHPCGSSIKTLGILHINSPTPPNDHNSHTTP